MADGRVLVVGDLLVDVVAVVDGPLRTGSDTAATIRTTGGGSAANTAAWLARAGAPAALLAATGDDDAGARARAELAAGGVALVGPTVAGAATGTCVVIVDPTGERTMLPDRAANDRLAPAHVGPALAAASRVHLSAYTLLAPGSRPAGRAVLAGARAGGLPVSVDVASTGPLADLGAAAFLDLLGPVDLLFANAEELDALGGEAAALAVAGAVVVKRGARGATWTDGRTRVEVGAVAAEVVDTTGAGDAFAAGVLAALLAGGDAPAALAAGAALAAEAVAVVGARPPGPF